MKILETRNRKGIKWRRYRGENGERITSLEIPEVVMKVIRKSDLIQAMKEYQCSQEVLQWKHSQLRKADQSSEE
jgi:hypothetical protein